MEMTKDTTRADQAKLAEGLAGLLADTYCLYNRTQLCHWNVEGPQFKPLHDLFEEQYTELGEAVDTIAERIRVLGFYTPGSLSELMQTTRLNDDRVGGDINHILLILVEGHQQTIHRAREIRAIAETACDDATEDLLIERIRRHEKMAWMLRAHTPEVSEDLGLSKPRRRLSVARPRARATTSRRTRVELAHERRNS